MIKPLIILFNTVFVFIFGFFFGDTPVTVTGNFPKNVSIGTEFVAEITVNKSNVGGFAKLQVEVPSGFTVKESDSKSGNFSFAGNIAKIIWTSIPAEQQFTVKMIMIADASAAGIKSIGSKFSYVSNNNKEVVEMTPVEMQVGDISSGVVVVESTPTSTSSGNLVPVTTTEPVTTPSTQTTPAFGNPVEPLSNVFCSRNITKTLIANEYNVEVKIKKPGIKGFAKFQEILPIGYTAKGDKTNGSSFSVSDGKAKFVWVSLPADDEMIVSYVLIKETADNQDVKLDGEFSYLENDQTKKVKLNNDIISFGSAVTDATTNNAVITPTVSNDGLAKENSSSTTSNNAAAVTTDVKTPDPVANVVAVKEGNVSYMVQIGAFRNAIQTEVLAKKFNISEKINSELMDGFSKFMVGNFNAYKEARNHREDIKQQGCKSAFVTAYNGPKRITVQEALMITSQKWYK